MYIPHIYKNKNINEVKDFIKTHGFGILISHANGKTSGTHIPFEWEKDSQGKDILTAHLAKANPQAKYIKPQDEVLIIFNGPHAYVSSSWYQNEEVPTWNYIAVHVYGTVSLMNESELYTALNKMVDRYEKNSKNPVNFAKMSKETQSQINNILGLSIRINEIQAAYKLSQNRHSDDYQNIINELSLSPDPLAKTIAKEMHNRRA